MESFSEIFNNISKFGFSLEEENSSTFLKIRIPVSMIDEKVKFSDSKIEFIDSFYDQYDPTIANYKYGSQKQFIRVRSKKKAREDENEKVHQISEKIHDSCHIYQEIIIDKIPDNCSSLLEYKFVRAYVKDSDSIYKDTVVFPNSYEVVTIKEQIKDNKYEDAIKKVLTLYKFVNSSFDFSYDDIAYMGGTSEMIDLLIKSHFYPTPTKFMYCLQCLDLESYEMLHDSSNLIDDLIDYYLKEQSEQVGPTKRYCWEITKYPALFYNTYSYFDPISEEQLDILRTKLEEAKQDFCSDDNVTLSLNSDNY